MLKIINKNPFIQRLMIKKEMLQYIKDISHIEKMPLPKITFNCLEDYNSQIDSFATNLSDFLTKLLNELSRQSIDSEIFKINFKEISKDLANLKSCYTELRDPIRTNVYDEIKRLENEIKYLSSEFGTRSFLVTVIDFYSRNSYRLKESVQVHLKNNIESLLRFLPYDRTSDERIYLTQKNPSYNFYSAYIFEKDTQQPASEHTFLLIELIDSAISAYYEYPIKFENLNLQLAINSHLGAGAIVLESLYKYLISEQYDYISHRRACTLLSYFNKNCIVLPISIEDYINSTMSKYQTPNTIDIARLYDRLIAAAPLDTWIDIFMANLVQFQNYKSLFQRLTAYLHDNYSAAIVLLTEKSYYKILYSQSPETNHQPMIIKPTEDRKS